MSAQARCDGVVSGSRAFRHRIALWVAAACVSGCEAPEPSPAADPERLKRTPEECITASTFSSLAARADPAVVFIETLHTNPAKDESRGLGSGFLISSDGVILTNHHVVRDARKISVQVNRQRVPARVLGQDPPTDLAVLKVDGQELPFLPFGESAKLAVGEWVVAIGNPFGLSHTVSTGIVSAKGRTRHDVDLDPAGYYDFLQTDASINPGNSGGPLLDIRGRVVGINTAIRAGANNIGFAIPIDMVKVLLPHLKRDGRFFRSELGVVVESLPVPRAKSLGITGGALVIGVKSGSAADRAGMREGDVVVSVNSQEVEGKESLRWLVSVAGADKVAKISIRRGTRSFELEPVLKPLAGQ